MRSAVQSCVPLQESTAHRCVFFVYRHQAAPKGLNIGIYGAESLLSKRQKWRWTVRERSDRAWWHSHKISQGYPKQLSWVQCERTDRIRRSPPGDWNILRPATWKSSTYESFVSAFLFAGNFRGTWKSGILFRFQEFSEVFRNSSIALNFSKSRYLGSLSLM